MVTPTVFELKFDTDQPLAFRAGQFVSIVIPGAGPKGRDLRRAYSIASPPELRPLELCIKLVDGGPGTQYLYHLRPGEIFRAFAPYGDFTYKHRHGQHICFIATGTGVAPFRAIVYSDEYRANPAESAHCFFGVRSETEILYQDLFEKHPDIKWVPAISQPGGNWSGFKGRVTDYMKTLDKDFPWSKTEFYLCGNGAMITEVKAQLLEKGVAKESVHQEVYYR